MRLNLAGNLGSAIGVISKSGISDDMSAMKAFLSSSTYADTFANSFGKMTGAQILASKATRNLSEAQKKLIIEMFAADKELFNGKDAANAYAQAQAQAGSSSNRFGTALKGLLSPLKNVGSALKSAFTSHPIAMIAGITTAVIAGITAWNTYSNSAVKAKKDLNDIEENYKKVTGEIEETNSKLDSNQSKIDELREKLGTEGLTFVEQSELDKLETANALLREELAILETQQKDAAGKMATQAASTYETEWNEDRAGGNRVRNFTRDIESIDEEIKKATSEKNIELASSLRDQRQFIVDQIAKEDWTSTVDELRQQKSDIITGAGGEEYLSDYEKSIIKGMDKRIQLIWSSLDPLGWADFKFNDILSNDKFKDAAEQFKKYWEEDADIFSKVEFETAFPELVAEADAAGISLYSLWTHMKAIAGVGDEVDSSISQETRAITELTQALSVAIANQDNLNAAIVNGNKSGGLSTEDISNVNSMFGDVEGYDQSAVFEKTSLGVRLNAEAINELTKAERDEKKLKFAEELNNLKKQYNDNEKAIRDYYSEVEAGKAPDIDVNALLDNRDALQANIETVSQLSAQYDGLTSAWQRYLDAQSGGESGDVYDAMYETLDRGKELYEQGLVGTNEFRAIADLYSYQDLSTASVEELVAAYENGRETVEKFFTSGRKGAEKFVEKFFELDEATGNWNFSGNTDEIAKELGISVEMVDAIFGKLKDYGMNVHFGDYAARDLKTLQEQAESSKKALEKLTNYEAVFKIDFSSITDTEEKIKAIDEEIQSVTSYRSTLSVDSEEWTYATDILASLIRQKQEAEKPAILSMDTSHLDEEIQIALRLINDYITTQNALELSSIDPSMDTSGLQADIDEAKSAIESLLDNHPEILAEFGLADDSSVDDLIETVEGYSVNIPVNFQSNGDASDFGGSTNVDVGADTTNFENAVGQSIADAESADPVVKIDADASDVDKKAVAAKNRVQSMTATLRVKTGTVDDSSLRSFLNRKIVKTITVRTSTSGSSNLNGTAHVNGTASVRSLVSSGLTHANGHAYASGYWGARTGEMALVGELGQEMVISPRTGRWYTVGTDGAEFTYIPKDAIVFNNRQTEALLKNGKINSRGTALASGTAYEGGSNVTASGRFWGGDGSSSSSSKKNTSAVERNTEATEDATEATENIKDWIEVLRDRLSRITDSFLSKAERALVRPIREALYNSSLSNMAEEINASVAGYQRYIQEANAVGLSDEYKSKVQNGLIDIQTITDEALSEQISSYEELVDKALDCAESINDLRDEIRSTAESLAQLNVDRLDKTIEKLDGSMSLLEKRYENLVSVADKNANLSAQTDNSKKVWEETRYALDEVNYAITSLKNVLGSQFSGATSNGLKIDTDDLTGEQLVNAEKYNAYLDVRADLIQQESEALEDLTVAIRENANAQADNIQSSSDNAISLYEKQISRYQSQIDIIQAKSDSIGSSLYTSQIELYREQQKQLRASTSELQKFLDKQVKLGSIPVGSDEWYELTQQIYDNYDAIDACTSNIINLQNAVDQIKYDNVERLMDAFSEASDEAEFLIDLLSRKDLVGETTGQFTGEGLASGGLIAQQMEIAKYQASEYKKLIEELDRDAAKNGSNKAGASGYNEYIQKRNELMSTYRGYIKDAYGYEDDMLNLVNDKIEVQKDLYKDIVDERKEALDKAREEQNYAKNVNDKTQKRLLIERQLRALQGNNSDSAMKKRKELNQQLSDINEEILALEDDKAYDLKTEALDRSVEQYNAALDSYLKNTDQVLSDFVAEINANAGYVNDTLQNLSDQTGYTIGDVVMNSWTSTGQAISDYSSAIIVASENNSIMSDSIINVVSGYDKVAESARNATIEINKMTEAQNNSVIAAQRNYTEYINSVYKDLLGRNATSAEISKWTSSMKSGMTDAQVRSGVASTSEYQNREFIKKTISELLGRDATSSELSSYMKQMTSGSNRDAIKNAIMGTSEYKSKHQTVPVTSNPLPSKNQTQASKPATTTPTQPANNGNFFIYKKDTYPKNKLDINNSIEDRLKWHNYDSSFEARRGYYRAMGFTDTYKGSATQNTNMIKWMKNNGFRSGGILKDVKSVGEDGLYLGRANEVVFTPEQYALIGKLVDSVPTLKPLVNDMSQLVNKSGIDRMSPVGEFKIEFNSPIVNVESIDSAERAKEVSRIVKNEISNSFESLYSKIRRNTHR